MIVIKPLRMKQIDDKSAFIHKAAIFYYDKAIDLLKQCNETDDENKMDLANVYKNLARNTMNDYITLRNERDLLKSKPFIFWE